MNTTEKLNAIADKCRELLALAEKRTPGKWEAKNGENCSLWIGASMSIAAIIPTESIFCSPQTSQNAAYIAACACAAEAGWRTTLAAIESVSLVNRGSSPSLTQREERLVNAIIAAWDGLL
jgi:hypothetical protein